MLCRRSLNRSRITLLQERNFRQAPLQSFEVRGYETAAVGRWSTNTLASWRLRKAHGLRWVVIAGGFIRYRVSAIRAFLADAAPRKRKPAKREPRSRATDAVPATQEPAR